MGHHKLSNMWHCLLTKVVKWSLNPSKCEDKLSRTLQIEDFKESMLYHAVWIKKMLIKCRATFYPYFCGAGCFCWGLPYFGNIFNAGGTSSSFWDKCWSSEHIQLRIPIGYCLTIFGEVFTHSRVSLWLLLWSLFLFLTSRDTRTN